MGAGRRMRRNDGEQLASRLSRVYRVAVRLAAARVHRGEGRGGEQRKGEASRCASIARFSVGGFEFCLLRLRFGLEFCTFCTFGTFGLGLPLEFAGHLLAH